MRNDLNEFLKDIIFHSCYLLFLNGLSQFLFNAIQFPVDKSTSPDIAGLVIGLCASVLYVVAVITSGSGQNCKKK